MRTFPLLAAAAVATALTAVAAPALAAPTPPAYSAAQLDSTQRSLNARLARPPAGIASWGVDPATGRVRVEVVAGDASALRAARTATADLAGATVVTVKERPRLFYNVAGGQAISTSAGRCSVGFSARSGSTTYVITAGHCREAGTSWRGYNGVSLGTMNASSFPSDDFATIRVSTSAWVGTSQVQGTASVLGSTEAAVGASTCRSGSTTGYRCGTIQAKNQTVNYGGGDIVYGLTRTSACAEPGDSGGSFVSGRQAQGMTSGGSGNCSSGGTTYFQPVNEVLSRYGLTLITG